MALLILLSLVPLFHYGILAGYRFDPSGRDSVIWFGRIVGLSLLWLIYSLSSFKIKSLRTRGPLVSLIFSLFLLFLFFLEIKFRWKIALLGVSAIVTFFIIQFFLPNITNRFISLRYDYSGLLRMYSIWQSFEYFIKNPILGWGTGSFATLVNEILKYPHNIFMELAMETGFPGLISFLTLCVLFFYKIFKAKGTLIEPAEKKLLSVVFATFLFGFFNAQLSGDIAHNPLLWFAAGAVNAFEKS